MRRRCLCGLQPNGATAFPNTFLTPLSWKRFVSIGGRASPPGFTTPPDKHPRIKQAGTGMIAQHVPGTTKLRYTNKKGRTFNFSIPVAQLTHPPVVRRAATMDGWQDIDTSFSDIGDLDGDMPSEVDECLSAASVAGDEGLVEMNKGQLQKLQRAFVQLCKDYVLMDTSGMKASMMYSELNNGPEYELFDRKMRRRRHWLAIRHRYEDVKELLWPSDALREDTDATNVSPEEKQDEDSRALSVEVLPTLPLADMMEALSWLEAASTFSIRKHRPYDTAGPEEFAPLDLSREVRVVASRTRTEGSSSLLHSAALGAPAPPGRDEAHRLVDRLISLGALCASHGVPLSVAFAPSESFPGVLGSSSRAPATTSLQAWLIEIPALSRVKDAVRVMGVIQRCSKSSTDTPAGESLRFSDSDGTGVQEDLLSALCRLVSPSLFSSPAALENIDEDDLCVLLRFATEVLVQNTSFFRSVGGSEATSRTESSSSKEGRRVLQQFTRLMLVRCRQLLHSHQTSPVTLLSGDAENIPFVDLQQFADHNHPEVRVHEKIGLANAQGLRHARLQSAASTTLAELLCRLERVSQGLAADAQGLHHDLLRHVAQKAALGKSKLTLQDVTRVLPLLAALIAKTSEQQVKSTYEHLLIAMSTTMGVALQSPQEPACILALLEGLASCHYTPSSYKLLEMVMLRMMMQGSFTLGETARCLTAMLQVVGPQNISQSVQQAIAMRVVAVIDDKSATARIADILAVLRALRYSGYSSFPSLVCLVWRSRLTERPADWHPSDHVRYAVLLTSAAALLETGPDAHLASDVSSTAREHLLLGLSPVPLSCKVPPSFSACAEEDSYQECLTTCAALHTSPTPADLMAWAHTDLRGRVVHSLCTPQLAVSTMEALETMNLAPSHWYSVYSSYLTRVFAEILRSSDKGHRPQLLENDAEAAARCLYLQRAPDAVYKVASALLEHEVDRLDAMTTSGAVESHNSRESSVCTFQQRSLERRNAEKEAEARLLRYCAALQHLSEEISMDRSAVV